MLPHFRVTRVAFVMPDFVLPTLVGKIGDFEHAFVMPKFFLPTAWEFPGSFLGTPWERKSGSFLGEVWEFPGS